MRSLVSWARASAALVCLVASGAFADEPAPAGPTAKPSGDAMPPPPPEKKPEEKPADPKAGEGEKKPAAPAAPAFSLKDLDGKDRTLSEFAGKWVVLEWTNYACPFVKKHYEPKAMQATQKTYTDKGVVWLSICSSAEGKQGHLKPDEWKKAVADAGAVPTTVLLDADGTVGRLYGARTTPEIRVICPKGTILYAGAIDSDPGMKTDPTKATNYVAQVLDAVLAGKDAPIAETKPYGCSVKYAK